jgi:hypothetical protein
MAYSQGGLIEATDYNNFINGTNQLNTVWGTGTGNAGYGQTAISTVSAAGLVTATQWSTLVSRLNSVLTHQSGSGSGISSTINAGDKINYLSTLATNINTAYTNRVNFASQGATTTGTNFAYNPTDANGNGPFIHSVSRTVTFASGDAARYFFNAGGQLNFVISSVTNNDGTARSGDVVTMVGTNIGGFSAFRQGTGGGRTGSGGTLTTNATTIGYYQLTTSAQTLVGITSTTSGYSSDTASLTANANGTQGANGDKGTVITFTLNFTSAARNNPTLGSQFNDSLNVTVNHRVDIVYPESTNLTSTWGTPTVA